ncbi:MAG: hypothetical protein Q8L72_00935 [Moraxellaceae bacterium]|nr:hypothetical protein [Moraxellaceae bacterium]
MPTEELIFEKPLYLDAARAARKSDRLALENIIKQGVDVNYESKETKTPWGLDSVTLLLWATVAESLESVEALLKAGADPNKGTNRGMVPLTVASALKDDDIFELLLIRYKADPNKILRAIPHKTPLMVLLQERRNLGEKRFQRAEMLIRYGADVNLGVDGGETAVIAFSIQGDWRAVYWLLEHGANPEVRDSVNGTVMCYLRNSYRANTLAPSEAFTYRDKVRTWLLARGVARSRVDPAIHPSPKCDD